jgi:hypothetical protein
MTAPPSRRFRLFGLLFVTSGSVTRARTRNFPRRGSGVVAVVQGRPVRSGADCPWLSFAKATTAVPPSREPFVLR